MVEALKSTRCGYVAIVGAPNAGKSTLLNQLVGAKVSIVSPKVQTTRARITAIAMREQCQIIFVDTPGIFAPRRRLDRAMVSAAWSGAADADVVLFLVDAARGLDDDSRRILEGLKKTDCPVLLALNKIDAVDKAKLLTLSADLNGQRDFAATFMISALSGNGVEDIARWLKDRLPEGPWLYPEDQLADVQERLIAAEITREQIYHRLHQELPYASTVETEAWTEQKNGSVRVEQVIYVAREGQRAIVLGKGGQTIKSIGAAARKELETFLGRKVHLFLFVKVRENWAEDPERYGAMGLDFPKD